MSCVLEKYMKYSERGEEGNQGTLCHSGNLRGIEIATMRMVYGEAVAKLTATTSWQANRKRLSFLYPSYSHPIS